MNKSFPILLLLAFVLCSCQRISTEASNRLTEIDSLVRYNQLDSAFRLIDMVDATYLTSSADSADFFFQKTRLLYKLYKPIESTNMIDYSIAYYENQKECLERLTDAYFYKGVILYDQGQEKDAIVNVKKAEYTAEKLTSDNIKLKIYENLFIMNEEAEERLLALGYAKKVLRIASRAKDKVQLARACNNIAVAYNKLHQADSANFYITKSMEMLKYIPQKEQIYILNNIGAQLIATNPQKAKAILLKAISIAPMGAAYDNLATIYIREGDTDKANELWNKALKTNDMQVKTDVMHSRFIHQCATADYEGATKTARQLIKTKDSLYMDWRENDIRSNQIAFDNIKAKQEYERKIEIGVFTIILLSLSLVLIFLFLRYRTYKTKNALATDQLRIKDFESQIAEFEKQGQEKQKEIESLYKKKEILLDKHRKTLREGHRLYTNIMEGQTIVFWRKKEFENFIEYYRLININFVDNLESEYDMLSPKNQFFLVMEHLGKSDKEIMRIMGLADGSIRSIRSRINKRRVAY
ncbi:tetratricopeptide repeat protein [Prevotella aurantiaca]|uniref:tetratricopeptide repeat protein n=1 Tax=Prevotella aurantiaca TaxID=596085 RepID=UPI0028DBD85C|nr:hypothetical protein [Prevotella aurantiaca]